MDWRFFRPHLKLCHWWAFCSGASLLHVIDSLPELDRARSRGDDAVRERRSGRGGGGGGAMLSTGQSRAAQAVMIDASSAVGSP